LKPDEYSKFIGFVKTYKENKNILELGRHVMSLFTDEHFDQCLSGKLIIC